MSEESGLGLQLGMHAQQANPFKQLMMQQVAI
jgi:hypothetical protein